MNTLTDSTLKSLQHWLLHRETELLAEIGSAQKAAMATLGTDATEVTDLKEQADKSGHSSVQDAEIERDRHELAEVQAALQRLQDGEYGDCIDCGKTIDLQRLTVMPFAARCIPCQTRLESAAGRY